MSKKLRVFEAFSGYGSQSMSLRDLEVNHEVVGISEIDPDAIIAYGSIRYNLDDLHIDKTHEEMRTELMTKNIGKDFKTGKSKIPRMKKSKLEMLYKFSEASNNFGDISIINPSDLPNFDYFTYSFPCTDISVAGRMEGITKGQTRSGLLYECEKIIEAKRPKYLLMENVKNLVGKQFINQFKEWCEYLESLGYTNYHNNYKCLNAKDFGIAQNRKRIFMISILGEHKPYEFPKGFKLEKRLKDFLDTDIEDKYYLSDEIQKRFKQTKKDDGKSNIIGTTAPEFRTIGQRDLVYGNESCADGTLVATDYKQPKQIIDYADRIGGCFDTDESKHQAGSVWSKNGLSPTLDTMQGGYRQPLVTEEINIEKVGHLDCKGWHEIETRVHSTNGLAPTVETRNRAKYFESNFKIRKLTPRECLRLMGVSDRDITKMQSVGLSDSSLYKLAGNSIVKQVLDALHRNMFLEKGTFPTSSK
jgi:DNA (cytosine-5)-methyltransferase 1